MDIILQVVTEMLVISSTPDLEHIPERVHYLHGNWLNSSKRHNIN